MALDSKNTLNFPTEIPQGQTGAIKLNFLYVKVFHTKL